MQGKKHRTRRVWEGRWHMAGTWVYPYLGAANTTVNRNRGTRYGRQLIYWMCDTRIQGDLLLDLEIHLNHNFCNPVQRK